MHCVDGRVKRAGVDNQKPRKRQKAADIDLEELKGRVLQLQETGKCSELTIPELKSYLQFRGKTVGGKKGDLLARLSELFDKPQ